MTKEQKAMLEGMSKLQRNCAIERMKDPECSNREVYIRAKGTASSPESQDTSAAEILNNRRVLEFLTSCHVERVDDAIMNRDKMLADLTIIAESSVEDVVNFGQTGHEYIDTETGEILPGQSIVAVKNMSEIEPKFRKLIKSVKQTKYGIEVTLHCAMQARKMIGEMQGFNAPIKTLDLTEAAKNLGDDDFAKQLGELGVELGE